MPNIVDVTYAQTGKSTSINQYGMREMQERAFEARNSQYLLLKAPPASGKSRALMFIALDKLINQGLSKAIIAVPERSIGGSFDSVELSKFGFFSDWTVASKNNLCTPGGDQGKVQALVDFMKGSDKILICTHATLRSAFDALEESDFDNVLLAIDEFHHVSADGENRLGELLRTVMAKTDVHIVAMTGSYFRGDSIPVLLPEDEAQFTKVTYNYYEQLNGYTFLKSLGIGYHFYQGKYTSAIDEILNTDQKTILHIPRPNSGESTKEGKLDEVNRILDIIGTVTHRDPKTQFLHLKRHGDGKEIIVADLVDDDSSTLRDQILNNLRNLEKPEDMDLIIALGMAKEGFDWKFCEHALTVGYRGSLTEVIQIIGRCTRDSSNKSHAQFTNLIAQPDATDELVKLSVNNMLKAITCSLLMEQVLAPNFKFKAKISDDDKSTDTEIKVRGLKEPTSKRVKDIIESDLNDLKAAILSDDKLVKALPGNVDPEVINKVMIPKIIKIKYPELSDEEVEEVRQHVVVDSVIKNGEIKQEGDKRFVRMADKFINIDDLHIDLIDRVNPFQKAFEILSKSLTTKIFKVIQDTIEATRVQMSDEEAILLWPKIKEFVKSHGREPNIASLDPLERRMADAVVYLKAQRRQQGV